MSENSGHAFCPFASLARSAADSDHSESAALQDFATPWPLLIDYQQVWVIFDLPDFETRRCEARPEAGYSHSQDPQRHFTSFI